MKRPVFAALVFIIGCATGGVVSQLAVPPVRAGTSPTRWEYFCMNSQTSMQNMLSSSGAQGWEMVAAFPAHYDRKFDQGMTADMVGFCFKRALP